MSAPKFKAGDRFRMEVTGHIFDAHVEYGFMFDGDTFNRSAKADFFEAHATLIVPPYNEAKRLNGDNW